MNDRRVGCWSNLCLPVAFLMMSRNISSWCSRHVAKMTRKGLKKVIPRYSYNAHTASSTFARVSIEWGRQWKFLPLYLVLVATVCPSMYSPSSPEVLGKEGASPKVRTKSAGGQCCYAIHWRTTEARAFLHSLMVVTRKTGCAKDRGSTMSSEAGSTSK